MKQVCLYFLSLALCLTACGKSVDNLSEPKHGPQAPTWQKQYDLGIRYLSEGNYQEAIIAFTAAIEIDPKRVAAYAELANVYLAMDDPDQAVQVLRDGIAATEDADLQAKLAELAESETEPEPSGPRTERMELGDGCYGILHYDEAGHTTHEEIYDPDGTLTQIAYFAVEGLSRNEFYNPDGTLSLYELYYYDEHNEAGNWTRMEQYNSDETLELISYHDAMGKEIRQEYYDPDGALDYYLLFSYDAAGNRERTELYDPDGTLSDAW